MVETAASVSLITARQRYVCALVGRIRTIC